MSVTPRTNRPPNIGGVPSIRSNTVEELRRVVDALLVRTRLREGETGDPLDKHVSYRDLVSSGLAAFRPGGGELPPIVPPGPEVPPPGGPPLIPPKPYDLQAFGGIGVVVLSWEHAANPYISFAEVWRAEVNNLANAVNVGSAIGRTYADYAVQDGVTYYYWVRLINDYGTAGPYSDVAWATTRLRAEWVLEELTGKITSTHLFESLNQRITTGENAAVAVAAQAEIISDLEAQYTVKIDANGYVAGFGLAVYPTGEGGVTSAFIVRTDRFAVIPPNWDPSKKMAPFVIGPINGVTAVGINAAYIVDATISTAAIKDAVITTAKIADAAITSAKIGTAQIGSAHIAQYLQSDFFDSAHGWRIDKNGSAQFANVTIRNNLGQTVFTSGQGIDWNYVVGGKPNGALAWVNQLNRANRATYLEAAVISEAYIEDLSVSTLKIKGRAVTAPEWAQTGPGGMLSPGTYNFGLWRPCVAKTIYVDKEAAGGGFPHLIWMRSQLKFGVSDYQDMQWQLLVGGVAIRTLTQANGAVALTAAVPDLFGNPVGGGGVLNYFGIYEFPSTGTYYVELQVRIYDPGTAFNAQHTALGESTIMFLGALR